MELENFFYFLEKDYHPMIFMLIRDLLLLMSVAPSLLSPTKTGNNNNRSPWEQKKRYIRTADHDVSNS